MTQGLDLLFVGLFSVIPHSIWSLVDGSVDHVRLRRSLIKSFVEMF